MTPSIPQGPCNPVAALTVPARTRRIVSPGSSPWVIVDSSAILLVSLQHKSAARVFPVGVHNLLAVEMMQQLVFLESNNISFSVQLFIFLLDVQFEGRPVDTDRQWQ